ncbi:MAG TPA: EamA family transporter, partial [Candidatus Methylomirabilis sp.]|nr:EamA family transporter [Candidatus Methylomirabilis sp.]
AACCWGLMAVLAKLLLRDRGVDPLVLVAIRTYLATGTLFVVAAVLHPARLRIRRQDFGVAAAIGLAGLAANNFLYFEALHLTSVSTALLLQYQAPILVALYTVLVQRQSLRGQIILALVLALIGCALVVRAYDYEVLRPNLLGVTAGLGTAFTFAFYILASRAALRTLDAWTLLAYAYFSASLFWLVLIPPWKILSHGFSGGIWAAFLAIALLGTVVPFGLFIGGLKFLPPTLAGIVSMLEPVVAATGAYVVLGETLLPLQILGGGLVLAAVILVQAGRGVPASRDFEDARVDRRVVPG